MDMVVIKGVNETRDIPGVSLTWYDIAETSKVEMSGNYDRWRAGIYHGCQPSGAGCARAKNLTCQAALLLLR